MKTALQLFLYVAGVILLGALLTPLLFWTVRALEPWALANGLMRWDPRESDVLIHGPLGFLTKEFAPCFQPSLFVAALLLAAPAARTSGKLVPLEPDRFAWQHLGRGFLLTSGSLLLLGGVLILGNLSAFRAPSPWGQAIGAFLGAGILALAGEWAFRGRLYAMIRTKQRSWTTIALTTLAYAILIMLQPESATPSHVSWSSGFALLPDLLTPFRQPLSVLPRCVVVLTLGWLLGYARYRTEALWLGTGLSWGALFAAGAYEALTHPLRPTPMVVGTDLLSGFAPAGLLLLVLLAVKVRTDHEDLIPNRPPSF